MELMFNQITFSFVFFRIFSAKMSDHENELVSGEFGGFKCFLRRSVHSVLTHIRVA